MAAIVHGVTLASTSNATSYTTGAFTPAANDLLVAVVTASGTVDAGSMSSTGNTGTWTKIRSDLYSTGSTMYLFVKNALASAVSTTVTFSAPGDAATGAVIHVFRISGMTKTGSTAVRQTAAIVNHAAANPLVTPTLAAAALTSNPLIESISGNETYGTTPPTGWTQRANNSYASPTTTQLYNSRDSGFTGTNSGLSDFGTTVYGMYLVEFDSSSGGSPQTVSVTGLSSASAMGTVSAVPGNVNIAVAGTGSAAAFGTPTVTLGNINVSINGLGSSGLFGTVTPISGPTSVPIPGLGSTGAFGALSIAGQTSAFNPATHGGRYFT